MNTEPMAGWERLRHGGLLLDAQRLRRITEIPIGPLPPHRELELRRFVDKVLDGSAITADFAGFVLEKICGFMASNGVWQRGSQIGTEWSRRVITGETVKPRQLWRGQSNAIFPVFLDDESRIGIGRGRKAASQVVQWLRAGSERLALLTNGRQWRLIFAGLDFDAWCEWDVELWFEEGGLSPQVEALRTLLSPGLWTPPAKDAPAPLLQAILDSRKGQAELSAVLGERVREAVELLVQAHGDVLKEKCAGIDPSEIYRAAVRVVMRMVVLLFAESRELMPRDNILYHGAYGLTGLLEELEKVAARGGNRLNRSWNAWPRMLALFRLVHQGSHHPALPVPAYGGELFAPGDPTAADGLVRALAVFETAAFDRELLPDRDVHRMLERITRTKVKVRQGRANTIVSAPVDFSDLSSEYIGILYEGLLDFELKTAPTGDPIVFLAVGNQPALPLSRLESMDDKTLANLLEKMKDTSKNDSGDEEESEKTEPADEEELALEESPDGNEEDDALSAVETEDIEHDMGDERHATRTRAEVWARRAVLAGKLVRQPKGRLHPGKRPAFEESVSRKARQIVIRVILPGEWYLVRWGGTRKGSATFYTRPGLAVPTVMRTLRPLAYTPPVAPDGTPDFDAPHAEWTPKRPEEILALKVCDTAGGSGTFPVATLRFLTEALFASLHYHGRVSADGERTIVRLLDGTPTQSGADEERLGHELLPCRPDDALFEPRLKAILRRHVVERCIYAVDLDPLAVELCRLSLWIETMDRSLPFSFLDHKIKCGNSLIGAWFDQFQHYPVMAWKNREGGDKNHGNGVHFQQDARGMAIKTFVKDKLTPDLRRFLQGRTFFDEDLREKAETVHAESIATLARLHDLPVQDSAERGRIYREELAGSATYKSLKAAMDLWCACWFWPADDLEHAPLPTTFAAPTEETRAIAGRVAMKKRFFHWELEFPDVFRTPNSGFDAILGNPPWENLQPNPEEFFSNVDPLFRTYGRLVKLALQHEIFHDNKEFEKQWIDYSADFNNFSHWVGHCANPYGDPENEYGINTSFSIGSSGKVLHALWRAQRRLSKGYSASTHPFRFQAGRIFTYKLFLEQCYTLLKDGGRLGQIVPSGIYSDAWSNPIRELFLDQCRWEWLFGFENRDKIFDIDSRFKFNPIILEKGGKTEAIRTTFMRRKLEDWEHAEALVTPYTRVQVERFSPHSKAILEIQSKRDLEILEKIYFNSVLLGDDGPNGWGIKYKLEFMMNTDAHLFPPRMKWEAEGYRPDEYSRWVKGVWRQIAELWAELGIDPARVTPIDSSCSERLKKPDVQHTKYRCRCAQPPYDILPIPRADIPEGILLSREGNAWVREEAVEDVALPLYEGRMIGQFDFSQKGWVSGKGRGAVWEDLTAFPRAIQPQYLMHLVDYCMHLSEKEENGPTSSTVYFTTYARARGVSIMDVTSSTNARTTIATVGPAMPHGHSAPILRCADPLSIAGVMNSFVFDWTTRLKQSGLHLVWSVLEELPLPPWSASMSLILRHAAAVLILTTPIASIESVRLQDRKNFWNNLPALTEHEILRRRVCIDVLVGVAFGLTSIDMRSILYMCDMPHQGLRDHAIGTLDPKGFWRLDKNKSPELRHTVLTLVAFHDLEEKIRACGGDREKGIEAFLAQNNGEGWMLPETLCLADYGIGHDERAKQPQPVASRLGPRFYDWQLAQTGEESWRECHLHARNLLGEAGYRKLLEDIETEKRGEKRPQEIKKENLTPGRKKQQGNLFE